MPPPSSGRGSAVRRRRSSRRGRAGRALLSRLRDHARAGSRAHRGRRRARGSASDAHRAHLRRRGRHAHRGRRRAAHLRRGRTRRSRRTGRARAHLRRRRARLALGRGAGGPHHPGRAGGHPAGNAGRHRAGGDAACESRARWGRGGSGRQICGPSGCRAGARKCARPFFAAAGGGEIGEASRTGSAVRRPGRAGRPGRASGGTRRGLHRVLGRVRSAPPRVIDFDFVNRAPQRQQHARGLAPRAPAAGGARRASDRIAPVVRSRLLG